MQGAIDQQGEDREPDHGALRRHLERRIRRSSRMFGRAATLRYVARLSGIDGDPEAEDFPKRAEDALGLEPGSLQTLMGDFGPS